MSYATFVLGLLVVLLFIDQGQGVAADSVWAPPVPRKDLTYFVPESFVGVASFVAPHDIPLPDSGIWSFGRSTVTYTPPSSSLASTTLASTF